MAIYFTNYEFLMRMLHSQPAPVCLTSALLAGGSAGVVTYTSTYLLDYLKSLVQTDDLVKPRHNSIFGYFREMLDQRQTRITFYENQRHIPKAFFVSAAGFSVSKLARSLYTIKPIDSHLWYLQFP